MTVQEYIQVKEENVQEDPWRLTYVCTINLPYHLLCPYPKGKTQAFPTRGQLCSQQGTLHPSNPPLGWGMVIIPLSEAGLGLASAWPDKTDDVWLGEAERLRGFHKKGSRLFFFQKCALAGERLWCRNIWWASRMLPLGDYFAVTYPYTQGRKTGGWQSLAHALRRLVFLSKLSVTVHWFAGDWDRILDGPNHRRGKAEVGVTSDCISARRGEKMKCRKK